MKKRSHIYRGVTGIFVALFVMLQIIASVAGTWAGRVNELLEISGGGELERSANREDYQFLSDYETPAELIDAEIGLNTRLAAEGAVTLKGMPQIEGKGVSLFGMRSGRKMQFGGSMGELTAEQNVVTLSEAMEENGFSVNPSLTEFYQRMEKDYAPQKASGGNVVNSYEDQGSIIGEVPVQEYKSVALDGYKDAAVVVLGRDAGESCCFYPGLHGLKDPSEFEHSPTGNILGLSDEERDLINWIKGQGFKKIVVLLNSSGAMEVEELKQDPKVDTIVWMGNPGAYGTYGIAKLLSGEILPSGHLPDTFAVNSALSPAAANYGIYTFTNAAELDTTENSALRNSWYLAETEGIYTGYKYYETRYFDSMCGQGNASLARKGETVDGGSKWDYDREVSYGFGYGVEGSIFSEEIVDMNLDWSGEKESTVTVRVKNIGTQAAKHAVQLYVSLPYTDYDRNNGVEKSAIQLIGYGKTGEAKEETYEDYVVLEPQETEDVVIRFNAADYYSYDASAQHDGVSGAYILEAGNYYFATGNGAHDALQAVLQAMYGERMPQLAPTGAVRLETLAETMRLTESNDTMIQNQLSEADPSILETEKGVTCLTRKDWAKTFPSSVETLTATGEMKKKLKNQFYDPQEALKAYEGPDSFVYGAKNNVKAADLIGLDYDDPLYEKALDQMTLETLVTHYLGYNEPVPEISFPVTYQADSPLGLIAKIGQHTENTIYELEETEQEYQTNNYVSGPVVAAAFSPLLQKEEGRLIANDAIWCGYNTWYGPGLNLHRTPYNGRNLGYYSEDSVLTGRTAANVTGGTLKYGIVTNAKHFAFNDQETNRDGVAVFLQEQAARENELRGFQIPIREGTLNALMTAFNRIGCTHVAAHQGLMNGIVRGEWGFLGYIITDSVKSAQYFLPRECLMAGNDLMLGASNNGKTWEFTEKAVKEDIVLQAALREAYHHKLYTYVNSILFDGVTEDSVVGSGLTWWSVSLRVAEGICLAGAAGCLILFIKSAKKERRE